LLAGWDFGILSEDLRESEEVMLRTVEAVIEAGGHVRLLEQVDVSEPRRALVTILDETAEEPNLTALLSEAALAEDWNREEEDAAWQRFQPEP
jgi:hypothetical protein